MALEKYGTKVFQNTRTSQGASQKLDSKQTRACCLPQDNQIGHLDYIIYN